MLLHWLDTPVCRVVATFHIWNISVVCVRALHLVRLSFPPFSVLQVRACSLACFCLHLDSFVRVPTIVALPVLGLLLLDSLALSRHRHGRVESERSFHLQLLRYIVVSDPHHNAITH